MKEKTDLLDELIDEREDIVDEYESIPIPMDCEPVVCLGYNVKDFQKGIDKVSELGGMITGLLNTGINEDNAIGLIQMLFEEKLLPQSYKTQVELAKIQSNAIVEREL